MIDAEVVKSLAPTGTLRAAINIGNPVLVQRNPVTGAPCGVTVDLACELGQRLQVPLEQVVIDGAGKAFETVKKASCDIGFLAIEPARAAEIDFTNPYVIIEGVYAAHRNSGIDSNDAVDRSGVRIAVNTGAAYDLFLTRTLKAATLVRAEDSFDVFLREGLEVVAGVKQGVARFVEESPVARMLPGRFMQIEQAMCLPMGRETGARYLRQFIEEMKASGFVAASLQRAGQEATVPPAA